jgi:hypothetical protein
MGKGRELELWRSHEGQRCGRLDVYFYLATLNVVAGTERGRATRYTRCGGMAEWTKATVLKTDCTVGSGVPAGPAPISHPAHSLVGVWVPLMTGANQS